MTLTIGIDAGLFPPEDHGGLAVYRRELIRALAMHTGDHRLIVYGRAPPMPDGTTWVPVEARDIGSGRLARVPGAFRQVLLPRAARRDHVDLIHFPLGSGSLRRVAPHVVSVHDLLCVLSSTLDYPVPLRGLGFRTRKLWHRRAIPPSLRRARRLIASSNATRDDLVRILGIPQTRISVVPLAVPPLMRICPSEARVESFAAARGLKPGYVLGLASIDPRKNVHRLLRAYARLPASLRAGHSLVVLLTQSTYAASLFALARELGIGERMCLVRHLPEEKMPLLYGGAAVLAFPSLLEGFGLPVLECMGLGVPVVASRVGGIPEVGGEAVEYLDPLDPADIAGALERVLGDHALAQRMRERGVSRAYEFTWERTAEGTLAAYREALA